MREAIEGIAAEESQCKDFITLYKISKDMAHASGYSFNATVDLVRIACHKVLYTTLYIMREFFVKGIETVKESDKIRTLRLLIESFNMHLQIQADAIGEIYKTHNGERD